MPKSVVSRRKLFREFSKLNKKYVGHNHLKNLRTVTNRFCVNKDIFEKELMFMLWAYDLEFWTLDYASENYEYSKSKLADRVVYPLMKSGYIYKHFDKLSPKSEELDFFRDEDKFSYKVRYALTQKARMLVQSFYNQL
jgi:hypothetical protein